jgi:hypothetical protein
MPGLTISGKRMVAESMYSKGRSFIGGALLLREHGGNEYVAVHLMFGLCLLPKRANYER